MSEHDTEYQAEYDKAMNELEAAADGKEPEVTTAVASEPKQDETTSEIVDDPVEELRKQLEEARKALEAREKALQDTQRWAHENARKLKEYERHNRATPELLKEIPELVDAVRYVQQTSAEDEQEQRQIAYEQSIATVFEAHPDAPELLRNDKDFFEAMNRRREAVGPEKFDTNPSVMIREITAEKLDRVKRMAEADKQAAVDAARRDAEKAARAKSGMAMPGAAAGASRSTSTKGMSPDDVWSMSPEEFRRMTSKVTGF
jgi:hypothetical protein